MKMATLILMGMLITLMPLTSQAETVESSNEKHYKHTVTVHDKTIDTKADVKEKDELVAGVKADAPKLVQLSKNWFMGVEGGKDLRHTDGDEGWFVFGKVTYTGTLFKFGGK